MSPLRIDRVEAPVWLVLFEHLERHLLVAEPVPFSTWKPPSWGWLRYVQ